MRKAQITMFVIIGLVALMLVAMIIFFVQRDEVVDTTVPAEYEPLRQHVQQCLSDITLEAAKEVAAHGGYLDPDNPQTTGFPLAHVPEMPTESDLVTLTAGGENQIPYYLYLYSRSDCVSCLLSSLRPSRDYVAGQLSLYLRNHVDECFRWGSFKDFSVEVGDDVETAVSVADRSIEVEYNRTVTASTGNSQTRISTFTANVPVPLGRYLDIANVITAREFSGQFLENYLQYLISTYGGINADLPPTGGYEESFAPKFWAFQHVQNQLEEILYMNVPVLSVVGARGVEAVQPTGDPVADGFLQMTRLDLFRNTSINASDIEITFLYPDQPIHFDVTPRDGNLIEPSSQQSGGSGFSPPTQHNYYNFFYDVSYPVVVELYDEDVVGDTDISYFFALEANLRDNKNMVQWLLGLGTKPWDPDMVEFSVDAPYPTELLDVMENVSTYSHNRSVEPLLCDSDVGTAPITIRTWEAPTPQYPGGRSIENVSLRFTCGQYASCPIGRTEFVNGSGVWTSSGYMEHAELQTKLPQCVGGILRAEALGYAPKEMHVSTNPYNPYGGLGTKRIELDQFWFKNITFEKYQVTKNGPWSYSISGPQPLEPTDEVSAIFKLQPGPGEETYETSAFVGEENQTRILLLPGRYDLKVEYFDTEGHVIPRHCGSFEYCPCPICDGLICDEETIYYPEEDVEIKPAPWGGYEREGNRAWTLKRSELYNQKELVIPIIVAPEPECVDDVEEMKKDFASRFPQVQPRVE